MDEVERADVVVHAGDWVVPELLDELIARSARLVACWGNNDGPELRSRLPERADVVLDGLRFTVVHETGGSAGRDTRMLWPVPRYRRAGVRPQPHSVGHHDQYRVAVLNPGSPTDRRRQPFATYMTVSIDDGVLGDVVLHRVEK